MRAALLRRTGARGDSEPAADQQFQNRAIIFRHDPRRAHHAARIAAHDLVGFVKCVRARSTSGAQTFGSAGSEATLKRIDAGDTGLQQAFARQIQPADSGVFIDIAQDIGQLQRTAQMMRQQDAVVMRQTEHPHRQTSDRAGNAVAIQIERRKVGRPDILRHIHLHAIDDGEKILALEIEFSNRGDVVPQPPRRMALIQRVDIVTPLLQGGQPLRPRAIGIGDVVDLPAEAVDLKHRLALLARQNAHRRVKRTAGRGRPVACVGCRRLKRHAPAAGLDTGRRPSARRAISPPLRSTL